MPRKLGLEAAVIRGLFRRRHPTHSDVSWVALDRLPIDTVAKSLGESRWFLSLSHLEGFGLPPIEAMAAEALVIGFHGEGGLEYASSENGLWCPTGDLVGCVAALARAIDLADKGADRRYLAAGRATAERYSPAVQEEALVRFWGAVMSRPSHQLRHMAR
jgi:glycosyltransferase involved in cell wall biosynthesis